MPTLREEVPPDDVSLSSSVSDRMMLLPESTHRKVPQKARPSGMWTMLVRPTKLASIRAAASAAAASALDDMTPVSFTESGVVPKCSGEDGGMRLKI
jgi:hypothetical protein